MAGRIAENVSQLPPLVMLLPFLALTLMAKTHAANQPAQPRFLN
jgi:hypothetical protein